MAVGAPAALAQPGVRAADETPARDAQEGGGAAVDAEMLMPMAVLRSNGAVLMASWLAIDGERVRAVDLATNQMVALPRADVLGVFLASAGARESLGIGGIASAMQRPLVAGGRVIARAGAGEWGMLRVVDGMTLPGSLKASAPEGDERVRWEDPILGSWTIDLDRVAWIWRERIAEEWLGFTGDDASPPSEDVVALANGDRIGGFVLELGSTLGLERADGTALSLPIDRIAGVWLANPAEERSGTWAFTDLGVALPMGRVIGSSDEHWTGTLRNDAGEPVRIAQQELSALVLAAERLVPLSSMDVESVVSETSVGGGEADGLIRRVRHPLEVGLPIESSFGVEDVLLSRALEARWLLPEGAERLVATARLPDPRNPWAGGVMVVEVDGREMARFTLTPDEPAAAVNVAVAGRTLTLRVEPGRFGPVQNAVLLHRPMVIREE